MFPLAVYQEFLRIAGSAADALPLNGVKGELEKQKAANKCDRTKLLQVISNVRMAFPRLLTGSRGEALTYLVNHYHPVASPAVVPVVTTPPPPARVTPTPSFTSSPGPSGAAWGASLPVRRLPMPTPTPAPAPTPIRTATTTTTTTTATPSAPIVSTPPVPSSSLAVSLESKFAELEVMKTWACADATSYRGSIAPGHETAVMARDLAFRSRVTGGIVTSSEAAMVGPTGYTWTQIRKTAEICINNKAAVCFGFALSAVYILMGGNRDTYHGPRLEIVATGNHVFVIVGRVGAAPGFHQQMPPASEWASAAIIVDGWYGSLGHAVVYKPASTSPFSRLKLVSYFDSERR